MLLRALVAAALATPSRALALLGHHDEAQHDRRHAGGECDPGHDGVERRRRALVAPRLGEPRDADDRQREEDRHPEAGHERGSDELGDGLAVDDRAHASAVSTAPRWSRRTKNTAPAVRMASDTTNGPSAPVPKIRVTP